MRHLICLPYSIENLHKMAEALDIGKHWYHTGKYPHYDIPKSRIEEIKSKCKVVRPREILEIIQNGQKKSE
jgi:hypothetical protein